MSHVKQEALSNLENLINQDSELQEALKPLAEVIDTEIKILNEKFASVLEGFKDSNDSSLLKEFYASLGFVLFGVSERISKVLMEDMGKTHALHALVQEKISTLLKEEVSSFSVGVLLSQYFQSKIKQEVSHIQSYVAKFIPGWNERSFDDHLMQHRETHGISRDQLNLFDVDEVFMKRLVSIFQVISQEVEKIDSEFNCVLRESNGDANTLSVFMRAKTDTANSKISEAVNDLLTEVLSDDSYVSYVQQKIFTINGRSLMAAEVRVFLADFISTKITESMNSFREKANLTIKSLIA